MVEVTKMQEHFSAWPAYLRKLFGRSKQRPYAIHGGREPLLSWAVAGEMTRASLFVFNSGAGQSSCGVQMAALWPQASQRR